MVHLGLTLRPFMGGVFHGDLVYDGREVAAYGVETEEVAFFAGDVGPVGVEAYITIYQSVLKDLRKREGRRGK